MRNWKYSFYWIIFNCSLHCTMKGTIAMKWSFQEKSSNSMNGSRWTEHLRRDKVSKKSAEQFRPMRSFFSNYPCLKSVLNTEKEVIHSFEFSFASLKSNFFLLITKTPCLLNFFCQLATTNVQKKNNQYLIVQN